MSAITAQPAKTRAEAKSDITDRTARAIIDAEIGKRDAKTERLRKAREASEKREARKALMAAASPAKKKPARKPASVKAKSPAAKGKASPKT
ncbi:MAG: hypothetical protein R3D43_01230 [Tepidamorphaceae bacterium]